MVMPINYIIVIQIGPLNNYIIYATDIVKFRERNVTDCLILSSSSLSFANIFLRRFSNSKASFYSLLCVD